ncbi:hypothetical protein PRUPE_1G256400 [Prunus persica]|uniref:NHL repeat-containing protein n=1 Tax=Prunus persica TaxID=3760 RepID=A0A251R3C4_PRUPE|nr:uncharacterized protein LOC18788728 isoform X1 [Prunus persica]ONI30534.1 hypothetical protein PRUPE_1G256400 [Prunus persica]
MASHSFAVALFFFFLLNQASLQVFADLVLEDGYTVTTVIDGHKLGINPYSVLPRPGSSDLLVLDSSGSAVYTVPFPIPGSQDSVIKRFSGNGDEGYSDGEPGLAQFKKPRSFAVDPKGNVFVADRGNNVIRKISASGSVSTIAGGYTHSLKPGREDGPSQNATFSPDLELALFADKCALLISDRGSQLVRLINLKPEDCARSSPSALGAASIWLLGLGLSCLFGLLVGIVIRPYIIRNEGRNRLGFSATWRRCQINLGKQVQTLCFAIKSATASSTPAVSLLRRLFLLCISHLSLMFRTNHVGSRVSPKECVSLIDCDFHSDSSFKVTEITDSSKYVDQLKDLVGVDGSMELCSRKQEDSNDGRSDVLSGSHGRIEGMIDSNIMGFVEGAKETTLPALGSNYGLVKRR